MSCKGYVYVLSNPSMPGLVKIGMSSAGGHVRAKQLYQTGVPTPFVIEFQVYVEYYQEVENNIHLMLDGCRLGGREFFQIEVDEAITSLLDVVASMYSMKVTDEHFIMDDEQVSRFCTGLNLHWLDVSGAINHLSDEAMLDGVERYRAACEERNNKCYPGDCNLPADEAGDQ